jgi:DNA-binding SARP family transcriptional activator
MPLLAVQYRILGPVEAIGPDGRPLRCSGRPLQLLALLLVNGVRVTPADVAIDALWGEVLPEHPTNALQSVVSRLRRVLGEEAIPWRAEGYELRLADADAVDARRFERVATEGRDALARGDHADASRLLADALGLWRGPALQDMRYEPFAAGEAERLEELRMTCLGERIDADLALGRHAELVAELQALVGEHPLRESLRAQLMLALYRGGRQADALAAYRDARQVLADELGLDPSPELQALERDILRHRVGPLAMPAQRPGRREVVCVAVDVRVSERGSPLDPEVLQEVLERCHDAMEAIGLRHGDPVRELREHGMIAAFGAPVAHEDDALRAAHAALALRKRLSEIATALAADRGIVLTARAGVTAGTVLMADGPRPSRLPVGDVIEAAVRLAREAPPGEIVIDARTRALLGAAARTGDSSEGRHVLRGLRRPAAPAPDPPLVGRERELQRLDEAFERAAQRRAPELVTVIGEPGIGKSRLARELAARLDRRATVLAGRCLPYGLGITYWPVREMVLQAADGRPLETLTAGLPDGSAAAASVAAMLGLGEGASGEATLWAFRRLFGAVAHEGPLVLLFEDVHWAEPPLLDLVDDLHAQLVDAPVLLLCLARPELLTARPAWASNAAGVTTVRLGPLSPDESRRLLAARSGLSDSQRTAVATRAGGNPLFLEQLAVHVAERHGPAPSLPPALHALLAARLDLLNPQERSLLDAAAVEGEHFHLGGVLSLVENLQVGDASRSLDALVKRELLLPAPAEIAGEQAWRFRHALVRDAAYEATPKAARAHGHERVAGWLATIETRVPEADARIGTHLEWAHRAAVELGRATPELEALAARAARHLAEAGSRAHLRGDLPSEIAFLSRAAALLDRDDPTRAELLPAVAAALFEAGSLDRAAAVAEEALAIGERLGLTRVRWRAAVEREHLHLFRNPEAVLPDASLAVTRSAVTALSALGDDLGLARAYYVECELVWLKGSSEMGYRNARRVLHHARRARSGFEIEAAISYMAWALVVNAVSVSDGIRECVSLQREVTGRYATLSVRGFKAVLDAMAGRFELARSDLATAREGIAELGFQQSSVWMAVFDAMAETLAGDATAAERVLEDAERIAIDIGDRWFQSTILVDRAHAILAQNRPDAAAEAVARIDDVPAPRDMEWRIKRHAAHGKLAAIQGDTDRALREARAATALADSTEMFTFRADAHRDLAEVAARCHRHEEARAAAATALALYEAKENVAAAAQLQRPSASRDR